MQVLRTERIDLTPDKSLMEKIGYVGFSSEQAFAEFVDNALDARHDEKSGLTLLDGPVTVKILLTRDRISCEDDSSGIENPKDCLRLGSSIKQDMLGAFGLGMKTAAMSFGRHITVESKRVRSPEGFKIVIDLDMWYEDPKWEATIEFFPAPKNDHYTRILVGKLHIDPTLSDTKIVKEGIGFRFSEFISNGELRVLVNGDECRFEPPEFMDKETFEGLRKELGIGVNELPQTRRNFGFELHSRNKELPIHGWVDILAKGSLTGRFGFNLYRGKRLIQSFEKIGVRNHPSHARIFGHIYLPMGFPVTFTKDAIEIQRSVALDLRQKMVEICRIHRKISEKLAAKKRYLQLKPTTMKRLEEYLSNIEKAVKESPLIQGLWEEPEKRIRSTEKESEGVTSVPSERRRPRQNQSLTKPIPKGERARQPRGKRQNKESFFLTVRGKRIRITHDFQAIDQPPIQMYYSYYDEPNIELQIVTNTFFESWGITQDEAFYAAMNIIHGLTDFVVDQAEKEIQNPRDIYEDLWRRVGKLAYKSVA